MTVVQIGTEASNMGVYSGPLGLEVTTAGRYQSAYSRVANQGAQGVSYSETKDLDTPITSGWVSFYYLSTYPDDDNQINWYILNSSGAGVWRMYPPVTQNSMQCQYYNGSTWVAVGPNFTMSSSNLQKYDIEFSFGSPGTFTLYQDGVAVVSGPLGNYDFSKMRFSNSDASTNTGHMSQYIVDDTDSTLGYVVETEAPTANGLDAVDGVGTYTDVDEAVLNTGDFVIMDTNAQKRSFTGPARTGSRTVIKGVTASARLIEAGGGVTNARFYLVIAATRYYSPSFAVGTTWSGYQYIWTTNPATGLAWDGADSDVSSLEWGVEALT
jgi:hypothetical protein